jgi:hypothetical protein
MPCTDFLLLHPKRSLSSGKRGLCLYRDSPDYMLYCPYGWAADCPNSIPAPFKGYWERPADEAAARELRESVLSLMGPDAKAFSESTLRETYAVPKEDRRC